MKRNMKKILMSFVLICALLTGCSFGTGKSETLKDGDTIGNGSTAFHFVITDEKGKETNIEVKTDETTVGDALQKLHVISGTEGDYGLFVDTVNGITVDYDKDHKYWAFYVDGEYASTSVSKTKIDPEAVYMFKMEEAMD